ncbi:MAG TPA: bifunctional phosphopantothenoylcysteine decarboxylase/phosphopantothenate--cysteine ligase CoaBC [Alphaproteobacteria bacterium]|jgi:phosphopantothenoylcysteine decarboxylase/phosphopantothenate--cysteine ligase|nr:bifunctional phosphopantothenoylcysteine decarboxylase/phosphopantothenate--cysteine ligase CoaBC [Alphaproteobacteria bacterium]
MLAGKRILLVISGGIAAYKSLDLIRRLRERGACVRCVLTKGGAEFVTPLSVAALSEEKVYGELFSLTDESEMGHIRLSREADLIVVAPLSADLLAKIAMGRADDLASAVLLATDKKILVAPAMNHRMWLNPATQENIALAEKRGVMRVGPNEGAMACGEEGPGRMAEVPEIVAAIESYFATGAPLSGRRALVTSGPTQEPIDPVRYIANRSSGKQGHAVAAALARLGADTTLVAGPTALADPPGVSVVRVATAQEMLDACQAALPVDVAVCAAAVADWRPVAAQPRKIKKNGPPPAIELAPNPDILVALSSAGNMRPRLVIGFAAETEPDERAMIAAAKSKLAAKGCDWIVANDVAAGTGTFGGDQNTVHVIDEAGAESWPRLAKSEVAERLARRISAYFSGQS